MRERLFYECVCVKSCQYKLKQCQSRNNNFYSKVSYARNLACFNVVVYIFILLYSLNHTSDK